MNATIPFCFVPVNHTHMPINYPKLVANLSGSRLQTYRDRFGCVSDAETIKLFFLFQDISSHLFTPLQLLEVTLRNGIHAAIRRKKNIPDWYNHIWLTPESRRHLAAAQSSATQDVGSIRPVTPDDIICRLPFGFWVYMLDAPYRNTNTTSLYLWDQHTFSSVFPSGTKGIKAVFSELKIINALRNRLFHHEPVWSAHGVNSSELALDKIKRHYQDVTSALGSMAPDQKSLLSAWAFDGRLSLACDITRFDRPLW